VKEHDINIDLSSIYDGFAINKIIVTPINTAIQGNITSEKDINLGFMVVDDKGRYIIAKSSNGVGNIDKAGLYKSYFNYNFKEVCEDSESLTFIPYERNYARMKKEMITSDNNIIGDPYLSQTLNLNGETKLNTKDG
ncbi:DUF5643 domain-containing protein, partial [Clostridium perfringens]|uniref:DUF5643 domain-containing protein n=1 Tax=Clostridium perfringens TaxID=1502 RepID=UPI002ACC2231